MSSIQAAVTFTTLAVCLAGRPAAAFTQEQVQIYLKNANPGCVVGASAPTIGHVRGSDKEVTIVPYLVEGCGGSNVGQSMFAVLYDTGGGRVGEFNSSKLPLGLSATPALKDGVITVTTLSLGPNDPHCCPTQKSRYRIVVRGDALVIMR